MIQVSGFLVVFGRFEIMDESSDSPVSSNRRTLYTEALLVGDTIPQHGVIGGPSMSSAEPTSVPNTETGRVLQANSIEEYPW
mmetsp:Transcript_12962/g.18653  ORF Transcript_12962/g.18653 Transcript_12962/m.18653 type:complete len:82 (+) Transcript_12962:459-704(+)